MYSRSFFKSRRSRLAHYATEWHKSCVRMRLVCARFTLLVLLCAFLSYVGAAVRGAKARAVSQSPFAATGRTLDVGPRPVYGRRSQIACEERWFEQKLDHFSWSNDTTWQQRYFICDKDWKRPSKTVRRVPQRNRECLSARQRNAATEGQSAKHVRLLFLPVQIPPIVQGK